MKNNPLPRLDEDSDVRKALLQHCRLQNGEVWTDPKGRHKVACIDATDLAQVANLVGSCKAELAIQDPPYNLVAFQEQPVSEYIQWCKRWVQTTIHSLTQNAAVYIWLGADQDNDYQPLPEFMLMMRETGLKSRSFITMRNQRGYGTQQNWMAVRQELLYYTQGKPKFTVQYTDIPKILRGYYKQVNGQMTENIERSKSENIRPGNVWVDVQQVFYRMEENVSGCYAQKPLKAIDRIVLASSSPGNTVLDLFAHSGTTLLACERHGRRCLTADIDPIYCEIIIRRLERFRVTGKTGWQNNNPFSMEMDNDSQQPYLFDLIEGA
jgi:site-specific DNA-methyltransferase (adenine-specific)